MTQKLSERITYTSLITGVKVLSRIAIVGVLVVSCSDLPPAGNCNCPAPCVVRVTHPNISSYDMGYGIVITDMDDGTEYVNQDVVPAPPTPLPGTVDYTIPCCKRVKIEVNYLAACVPGSPLYGFHLYYSAIAVSPQTCTTGVTTDAEYHMSTCTF